MVKWLRSFVRGPLAPQVVEPADWLPLQLGGRCDRWPRFPCAVSDKPDHAHDALQPTGWRRLAGLPWPLHAIDSVPDEPTADLLAHPPVGARANFDVEIRARRNHCPYAVTSAGGLNRTDSDRRAAQPGPARRPRPPAAPSPSSRSRDCLVVTPVPNSKTCQLHRTLLAPRRPACPAPPCLPRAALDDPHVAGGTVGGVRPIRRDRRPSTGRLQTGGQRARVPLVCEGAVRAHLESCARAS